MLRGLFSYDKRLISMGHIANNYSSLRIYLKEKRKLRTREEEKVIIWQDGDMSTSYKCLVLQKNIMHGSFSVFVFMVNQFSTNYKKKIKIYGGPLYRNSLNFNK